MALKRVIPVMLISNRRLVKGVSFSKYKYVGDPINAIKIFNEKCVDEIIILDINASKSSPDYDFIEKLANESFMPLCYGGGIKTLSSAKRILSLGVEKISIQSAAINNLSFIQELSECFGSQSIVLSIDVKKSFLSNYALYNSSNKKLIKKIDIKKYIHSAISLGVGEVLLCSVNKEGSMAGPDLDLIKNYSNIISVPLIISGGIGSTDDIYQYFNHGADAVAIGAFSVFHGKHRAVLISYPNMDFKFEEK